MGDLEEVRDRSRAAPQWRRSGPTWAEFLRAQAEAVIATDLFTVDLLGGAQVYCLAVFDHATRRIHVLAVPAIRPGRLYRRSDRGVGEAAGAESADGS
jgi:hypothetical protein